MVVNQNNLSGGGSFSERQIEMGFLGAEQSDASVLAHGLGLEGREF